MKIFKRIASILGSIIAILLIITAGIWIYYGGLTTIIFSNPEQGGEILVYKEVVGDYNKSGDISREVYYFLRDTIGVETYSGFGIFYDDPSEVDKNKCRSDIGCILEPEDINFIPKIEKHFKVKVFPVGQYTSTDFPYKGMLSIFVGMFKVYPAIKILKEEKNHLYKEGPIMEIYNMRDSIITYRLCGNGPLEIKAIKAPQGIADLIKN